MSTIRKRIITILLVLTLAFIWGNSLLPREISGAASDRVMERMNRIAGAMGLGEDFFTVMADQDGDGVEEPTSRLVRKMAHIFEFAVLGALLWLRLEGMHRRVPWAFALGISAAAMDETLQIFSHRGSQLRDVLIDAVGTALGIAIICAMDHIRNRRRQNR